MKTVVFIHETLLLSGGISVECSRIKFSDEQVALVTRDDAEAAIAQAVAEERVSTRTHKSVIYVMAYDADGNQVMMLARATRLYLMAHAPAAEIVSSVPTTMKKCAELLGVSEEEFHSEGSHFQVLAKLRAQWADAILAEAAK